MGLKDEVRKAKKQAEEKGGDGAAYWKPSEGVNKIVLFPGFLHEGKFVSKPFVPTGTHFNTPNGERVDCPLATKKKPCRICEAWQSAKNGDGDEEDLETCRVSKAWSCLVIDTNDKSAGVQIWKAPRTAFDQLMDLISDPSVFKGVEEDSALLWLKKNPVIRFVNHKKAAPAQQYTGFRPTGKRLNMSLKKYKKAGLPDLQVKAMAYLPTYEDTCRAYEGEPLRDSDGKSKNTKSKKKVKKSKKVKGKKKKSKR